MFARLANRLAVVLVVLGFAQQAAAQKVVEQVPVFNAPDRKTNDDEDEVGAKTDCEKCLEDHAKNDWAHETWPKPVPKPKVHLSQALAPHALTLTGQRRGAGGAPGEGSQFTRGGRATVLPHSGQAVYEVSDLYIEGRDVGVPFEIRRRHTTRVNHDDSLFGRAWAFNYRHTFTQDGADLLFKGFGREDRFEPGGTTPFGGSIWDGTAGRLDRVIYNAASSTLTLRRTGGVKMIFHVESPGGALEGHLVAIQSPNGNALQFEYQDAAAQANLLERRLLKITESYGREILFFYTNASHPDFVTEIRDFSGRSVIYTYDAAGNMIFVRSPTVTSTGGVNDFPKGKTFSYAYRRHADDRLKHALVAVTFPIQVQAKPHFARLAWTYDEGVKPNPLFGYVESHWVGKSGSQYDPGGVYSYTYSQLSPPSPTVNDAVMLTTMQDPRGTVSELHMNMTGQMIKEVVKTNGLRASAPADYTRSYTYTNDGLLLSSERPLGGRVEIDYPDPAIWPRSSAKNPTTTTIYPDSRGANQTSLKYEVMYEPVFNQPFKTVDPRGHEPGNRVSDYTTTYLYDYMEDLSASRPVLAYGMGITEAELQAMFDEAGVTSLGADVNGDGSTSQRCGNVVKIEHPIVKTPDQAQVPPFSFGDEQAAVELFRFDDFGKISAHVDAEYNLHQWSYYGANDPDGDGVIDVPGASTTAGGFLKSVARDVAPGLLRNSGQNPTPVNQVTQYEYTAQWRIPANQRGVPTAIIDPRGIRHLRMVNELDQVVGTARAIEAPQGLAEYGYQTYTIYDLNDNVVEIRVQNKDTLDGDNDFVVWSWTYDILDFVRTQIEDVGGEDILTTYEYDASMNTTRVNQAVGTVDAAATESTYDERDIVITVTSARGQQDESTMATEVDDNGNITKLLDASLDETILIYDGYDRAVESQDRVGTRTVSEYDSADLISSIEVLGLIDGVAMSEVSLSKSEFSYDERQRAKRLDAWIFHYNGQSVGMIDGGALDPGDGLVSTVLILDRLDRTVGVVDAENDASEVRFDGIGRPINMIDALGNERAHSFDANSNLNSIIETEIGAPAPYTSSIAYDSLNRPWKMLEPNGQTSIIEYDSRDNAIRVVDMLGNQTEYRFDRLSRPVDERRYLSASGILASAATADPAQGGGDGVVTLLKTWDALHRLKSQSDDSGNTTTHTWDDLGRMTRKHYGDSTFETWIFNADSELQTHTNQKGSIATWTHDAKGRPTQVSINNVNPSVVGSTLKTWRYDGLDRIWGHFDNNTTAQDDVTVSFTLDSLGRRIRELQQIQGMPDRTVELEYQGYSRLVSQKYPNTRKVTRSYDALDRLFELREESPPQSLIARYEYVGPSRKLLTTFGNGTFLDKSVGGYDSNRRSVRHEWLKPDLSVVTAYVNTYNGTGGLGTNRRLTEKREHLSNHTDTYLFDSRYRMLAFERNGTINSIRTLDGVDKMLSFLDEGTNRMPVVDGDPLEAGLNQYSSFDGATWTYDDAGSLVDETPGSAYEFDSTNRLVTVDGGAPTGGNYIYDAENRRVARVTASGTVRYLYGCDWSVLEEQDETGTTLRQYVDAAGIDEHVQLKNYTLPGSPEFYYHCNSQGFVGALTDSSGDVVEYYEYSWLGRWDVFAADGTTSLPGSLVGNAYAFQGRRFDSESSLYCFRNRYYDPRTGGFISIDPSGLWTHGQGNGYSAFGGDPWNYSDPFGLCALTSKDDGKGVGYAKYTLEQKFWFHASNFWDSPFGAFTAKPAYQVLVATTAASNVITGGLQDLAGDALHGDGAMDDYYGTSSDAATVGTGIGWGLTIFNAAQVFKGGWGALRNLKGAAKGGGLFDDAASVATRGTRSGGTGARVTRPDGSVLDITSSRVKEFLPNTHPKAPPGTLQKVKFPNAQPGTKGFKRDPTPQELDFLNSLGGQ